MARVWQSQVLRDRELVTVEGEWLHVIYPGRTNSEDGPDFHHAIIATKEGELRGDVELHVRSSGWWAHGHHRDPRYNGVILHVVMWYDREGSTVLQDGRAVPILALHPYLEDLEFSALLASPSEPSEPCGDVAARLGDALVGELLDGAGEERFRSKASYFRAELARKEGNQVLYEGLMGALGYSRNKEPFEKLACRMPLKTLEGIAHGEGWGRRGAVLGAALLGEAGLVEWHLSGVRPRNMPQRRIAAAGYLLARYLERGLVQGLLQLLREADAESGHRRLERGLMIKRDEYGALIGQGRAREMAVNILLPFSFAWDEGELREHALALYRNYPRLEENRITSQMRRQLFMGCGVVNSARRQQGLLHLYRSFCVERKCSLCPFMLA
ncbi:MAG: DUF2851 family protein [Dehalococcoidia bacterium]|nr:DUF2851 family protein [Dehalococcoidia bacterium]